MKYRKRIGWSLCLMGILILVFAISCSNDDNPVKPNNPPGEPTIDITSGSPPHNSNNQSITPTLNWKCTDPDGDALKYDVYFGESSTPPIVSSGQTATSYSPGTLGYDTTYYWRIVAKDNNNNSTSSPIWSFKTASKPIIEVNPKSILFKTKTGGGNPSSRMLSLNTSNYETVDYQATKQSTWLSLSNSSGSTPATIIAAAKAGDSSGYLPVGTYTDAITITSAQAGNSPVIVSCTLQILGNPELKLSREKIEIYLDPAGEQKTTSLYISNSGTGELSWSISYNAAWITLSQEQGTVTTGSNRVDITVNSAGLSIGSYSDYLEIESDGGNVWVPITILNCNYAPGTPRLSITPSRLDFGSSSAAKFFVVRNTGNGSMNWSTDRPVYDIVYISPLQGTTTCEADTIYVRPNRSLAPNGGSHTMIVDAYPNGQAIVYITWTR